MAQATPQNFENHVRFLPAYHFVAFPLFFVNFCYALYVAVTNVSIASVIGLAVAVALVLLCLLSRMMVVTVQDRLIRLEERLRMRTLLPADLQPHIDLFTVKQLVALRFASDGELPALARAVIERKIEDQKAIKKMIAEWRADYQRA